MGGLNLVLVAEVLALLARKGNNRHVGTPATVSRVDTATHPHMDATAMVERVILLTYGVLRVGVVTQMLAAAVTNVFTRQMQTGSLAMTLVSVTWSIGFFIVAIHRRSFLKVPLWCGVVDVLIAIATLVVMATILPDGWQVGTWHSWDYAYAAVAVPTAPAWLRSRAGAIAVAVGASSVYAVTVVPHVVSLTSTVVINAVSFVIFASIGAILCPAVRKLARTAEENAERAVRLAAELEQTKYRFHIHNATGLLARLASNDTPGDLLPSLRTQALAEVNRLRHEALGSPGQAWGERGESPTTLERVAHVATAGFGHLPLEVRTTLGRDVLLTCDEALALESALISLLYNVEFHAHASEVVLHVDAGDDWWEASVCDDGIGFDPDVTSYGFGMQSQVLDSAQRLGMTVTIESQPDEGTCVSIRGKRPSPVDARHRLRAK